MWRSAIRIMSLLAVGVACTTTWSQDRAVDADRAPDRQKQDEFADAEREVSVLPRVRVQSISRLIQFTIEDDLLSARTTLSPVDGEVRVIAPDLPGIARLRVLDLPAVDDPSSGRNFTFLHNDLSLPGSAQMITHVASIAGRLLIARDFESDAFRSSVQLIQDPPALPGAADEQPVRLLIRVMDDSEQAPRVDLALTAATFVELRRKYPRELETYLRPLFRSLGQDQPIFAVNPRVAWQVLGRQTQVDPEIQQQVKQALAQLESDDFRQREAGMEQLRRIGQPAALALQQTDRSSFSAEQSAGVDSFLSEYLLLSDTEAERLRASRDFLVDTLECEDPALRELAAAQLGRLTGSAVDFSPDAPAEQRAAQLRRLRDLFERSSATKPSTP